MLSALILLGALVILGVGFVRARPFGKLGILAWLQSVVLMAPWLGFLGLLSAGIYLNFISILFLFLISTGFYIFLGRQLRIASQDPMLAQQLAAMRSTSLTKEVIPPPLGKRTMEATPLPSKDSPPDLSPMPPDDLKLIKGIFGIETFYATETVPFQDGVIFNGNLRGDGALVHSRLSRNLQERVGDRYRLFLVENPDGKPVVVVLPRSNEPKVSNLTQKLIALLLFIATLSTCLIRGGIQSGFNLVVDWQRVSEALPITIGLLVVLMSHELGHWWVARHHQVRLSWPFFLPTWEIGSFGAITRFESILPNRSVLFDISIAGPLCGGLVSITMLIIGLFLSRGEAPIQVPSAIFEGSLLVSALAKTILGESLQEGTITIHPLTIIGWVGLVITALNVMPAGQLDGGRIIQAIYGRKMAGRTSFATLIILGLGALFNALALYWAVVILVLQQGQERPSLNDITEPDDSRAALALLMLFIMVITLLPLTPVLAGRLGIGG